jgi:acylpyruvate hydrolase
MKLGRISSDGWLGFAVSADGQGWLPFPSIGVDPVDTATAIAVCRLWQSWSAPLPPSALVRADALHCPITANQRIVGVGANFAAHAAEVSMQTTSVPHLFERSPHTLAASGHDLLVTADADQHCDYEVELAVVIDCRMPDPTSGAATPVFGYAVANDLTLRALQRLDPTVVRAKSALRSCPVGPFITTADEIEDIGGLEMVTSVNGEVRQRALLRSMVHSVADLVAGIEQAARLQAGDVILTGSPAGTAAGRSPSIFLRDADVVECSIERLGTINNTVRLRERVA